MTRSRLLRLVVPVAIAGGLAGAYLALPGRPRVVADIPARIADTAFWRMFNEMSEPEGYFRSDNLVSNEAALQYVIPGLKRHVKPGGVYLGVGPDQNFTYIAAFRPRIAFIVDIRRQNAMQHLMYKALIELSADRAEFLSRLFSRPRPPGLDTTSSAKELLSAYAKERAVGELRDTTMEMVSHHLRVAHGFPVTDEDFASVEFVHGSFYEAGPDLRYTTRRGDGSGRGSGSGMRGAGYVLNRRFPTYADLMMESDGRGLARSYLATEQNFRILKDLETRNLIVPVVGDFAGDKALRAVGKWLGERGARVSLFYASNVEQYLFQQDDAWVRFYRNLATLPIEPSGSFIRSVSQRSRVQAQNPRSLSAQLVMPIADLVDTFRAKKIRAYRDVVGMSR